MTIHYVQPVIERSVRNLCVKPYYNHPKGCPNYNKRNLCPPAALLLTEFIDLDKRVLAVCVHFNLGMHVERMKDKHPNWSQRQCECCLYWQGSVKKKLKDEVAYNMTRPALFDSGNLVSTDCPEAMGVNVTATMANVGIVLEWPPKKIVRKIAFIGSAPRPITATSITIGGKESKP